MHMQSVNGPHSAKTGNRNLQRFGHKIFQNTMDRV
jgi:hypothetical protein